MPADSAVAELKKIDFVNVLSVTQSGGVVVKGMLTSSLKDVVRALQAHRLIDGEDEMRDMAVANGSGAMALALEAADHVNKHKLTSLADAPQMRAVRRYNESDCHNMARIVYFLRAKH